MSSDVAILVRNLTKIYRIFDHPGDRIRQAAILGLRKYHKEYTAIKDVSFEIRKGETVGIIGRNGSGKSTLLQLICGILKPTAGTVTVNGRISALLELGAGFNAEFTGRENVYFQGALLGLDKEKMDERFDAIAAFAEIGDFIEQPVRTYSSGMFVRLAFALAIHVDPEILVVDEALAVGDISFQAKCISIFNRLRESGVTVLYVSHDPNAIKSLCDFVIWLDHGCISQVGLTASVVDEYIRKIMGGPMANSLSVLDHGSNDADVSVAKADEPAFHHNHEFAQRVARFRLGSGEAQLTDVEVLDDAGLPVTKVYFGQSVLIRLHVLFRQAGGVVVTYYIRDDKHLILVGSTTRLENYGLVDGAAGARKIVEFSTALPLAEGVYNVLAILSAPHSSKQNAQFVDYVENASTFQVAERTPIKLWSKLYLPNTLSVHDV